MGHRTGEGVRLLDLFCGAGGAAMGYHRAGFDEIVGVDNRPQKNYPFEFVLADAMTYPLDGFDAIHASPPCQAYSLRFGHLAAPTEKLIAPLTRRFAARSEPWVIENVLGAVLPSAVVLCGTSFGLAIHRHRYFQSTIAMLAPGCLRDARVLNPHWSEGRRRIGALAERQWREAMDCAWMQKAEARQAIPPAYTEYIGRRLLEAM